MLAAAIPMLLWCAAANNMLANPDFDAGLDGWRVNAPSATVSPVSDLDENAVRIVVPWDAPSGFPLVYQQFDAKPGEIFEASANVRTHELNDGYGPYAALQFMDANGRRISFTQSSPATNRTAWDELQIRAVAPEECMAVQLCLIFNGHGVAHFSGASLIRLQKPMTKGDAETVKLTITEEVVSESLLGFGFEDDGYAYTLENRSHGLDDEGLEVRRKRIEWMSPDWVRMFFWHKDWCPSGDWANFDFDTEHMQSRYRSLDIYQSIGAHVNVTGVEWGMERPYDNPAVVAPAIAMLLQHLIKDKGYSCIKYWTLTNEPNLLDLGREKGYTNFTEIHTLVKKEFHARGLDVKIIGSDDADNFAWFSKSVNDRQYYDAVDLVASHSYGKHTDRRLIPYFFDDRMGLLRKKPVRKPFVITEFGFRDDRSDTMNNPVMKTFPYALWTMEFCIRGLNRGVAGFSIWSLHEIYYPGDNRMGYGLWDFKRNEWPTRPVYHAWAMLCRLTKRGDPVRRIDSSHPEQLIGANVGDTLFWLNLSERQLTVDIQGRGFSTATIMSESSIKGDRESGESVQVTQNRFQAPPKSFGYVR